MTSLKDSTITQLEDYLKYVNKQEKQLSDIEAQKDELSNTYFKDKKILLLKQDFLYICNCIIILTT